MQVLTTTPNPASPQVLCANALGPRENATRALWHLSSAPDNQLMIAREGALPALVANLSADSDRAKEFAAAAMESLSRDCPENQVRTRTLARFTRDWTSHARLGHHTSHHASAHHDASAASAQVALARAGAIAPLVGLLGAESEATQGYADCH